MASSYLCETYQGPEDKTNCRIDDLGGQTAPVIPVQPFRRPLQYIHDSSGNWERFAVTG